MTLLNPAPGADLKYRYASGQRPLDGCTIKHSIGRGAFGEVYFALTDGGKEVALKLIRDNLQVELRGIAQCLNLKHPNLVHLYDLRTDERGDHWLVMEYVEGASLRTILDRHPNGVAPELAAQWFQGLAAGVQYLHDHGIVHRDLKPGNVFLEKGMIKIGDYSLCKLMDSERGMQTESIGTVHYMAPEISTGNYNRQVDIYAAGVVLYEMLVGRCPFDGDTAGEILMKHLTSMPDLSKVPSAFIPILDQALRKNPAHRFQSLAEMAKLVAQCSHHAPRDVFQEPAGQDHDPEAPAIDPLLVPRAPEEQTANAPVGQRATGWKEFGGSMLYAALLAALGSLAWCTVFASSDWWAVVRLFMPTAVCAWMVMLLGRAWPTKKEDSVRRRLVQLGLGALLGIGVMWLDGHGSAEILHPFSSPAETNGQRTFGGFYRDNQAMPILLCYVGYYGLMLGALRWWKLTDLRRPEMFSLQGVVATILWGFLLLFLLPSSPERQAGFASLVLVSAIVQLSSPWEKTVIVRKKRFRLRGA